MLEKIKHSKIKNTGIIAEILIKKMIEQAVQHKKPIAYNIFNHFFNKRNLMSKQLSIYEILTNQRYQNQAKATDLLEQALKMRMSFDEMKLQKEKYLCIKEMKKHYDIKELFNYKVSNYKVYASIYKVFESLKKEQFNPINIVESKYQIIEYMLKPMRQQVVNQDLEYFRKQSQQIRQQVLKVYCKKFNQKYSTLSEKQKKLLRQYAYSMSNATVDKYINNQLNRLKDKFKSIDNKDVEQLVQNIDKIKNIKPIQDKIYSLLNLYEIEKMQYQKEQ